MGHGAFARLVVAALCVYGSSSEDASAFAGEGGDDRGGLREVDYALIAAAAEGDAAMARRVLEAGADARAATEDGETALHTCGISGSADVARLLLAAGADPDARVTAPRGLKMTPLTWFAYGLHEAGARALLDGGATLNLVVDDERGDRLTALDIASRLTEGHELVALFRTRGGKRYEELDNVEREAYTVGGDVAPFE